MTSGPEIPVLRVAQAHVRIGDPHVCSDDRSRLGLLRAVYEPLVRRTAHGRHRGVLAERWTASPDARVWTFELRSGARWHDGPALSADDVVASLGRIRDDPPEGELGTSGVYQGYLAGAELEALGPARVRVTLAAPMADLLDVLAELVVLRADQVETSRHLPAGTGPFRWASRGEQEVVLERANGYWGAASPVARARFEALADPRARLERVRDGRCDLAADVPLPATGAEDTLRVAPGGTITAFMANLREGPLRDVRVRRALNLATDVQEAIQACFGGHAAPVASPCSAPQLGFDPNLAPYPYDPDRARALLAEAGAERLALRFDVPEVLPDEAVRLGELLAEQYARIGVELTLERHADRPAYADRVREGRIHDAACFDSTPVSSYRLFREKFHAGVRGPWWLGYERPAFDATVDEAAATPDPERRAALYRGAARMLHDDAPWIYLYAAHWGWAVGPAAAGWRPAPEGWVDLASDRFDGAAQDGKARS
jgi:peptide/nickel transport system substrate-binding protein